MGMTILMFQIYVNRKFDSDNAYHHKMIWSLCQELDVFVDFWLNDFFTNLWIEW